MQCGQQDFMPLPLPCFNSFLERKRQQEPDAFFFFCKVGRTKRRANSTRNMACSGSAAVAYRGAGENVGPRTGTCKSRGGGGVRGLSLTVADASSSRRGVRAGGYSSYTQCAVHALRIPAVPLCQPASRSACPPDSPGLTASPCTAHTPSLIHPPPNRLRISLPHSLSTGESDRTAPLRAEISRVLAGASW